MSEDSNDMSIPKSTLMVGAAFWAVLFAMSAWLLSSVVGLEKAIVRVDGKLDAQTGLIRWNAVRQDALETRVTADELVTNGLRYQVDALREKR